VIIGAQRAYPGIPCTRVKYQDSMSHAVGHLLDLGHRRLARISGPNALEHVARRQRYFTEVTRELLGTGQPQLETDYTAQAGVRATRQLLSAPHPPTAIIYDNDVMAVASVAALTSEGVRVPADLAVLAWDDSPLCQLVAQAAELLLTLIESGEAADRWLEPPRLTVRGSTAGVN
jgi:DNA-binding LacI/PurR family transcriptional regulator